MNAACKSCVEIFESPRGAEARQGLRLRLFRVLWQLVDTVRGAAAATTLCMVRESRGACKDLFVEHALSNESYFTLGKLPLVDQEQS